MAALLAVGCGSSATSEDGVIEAEIKRLDLPRLDESARVTVLANARPAAIIFISADGTASVGKVDARWSGDIAPPRMRTLDEPVDLRRAVLEAVVEVGGPQADEAHGMIATAEGIDRERALRRSLMRAQGRQGDPLTPGAGRLPAADAVPLARLDRLAPLVIATPSAPATKLARVLQSTGGAIAVDHLGKLAVLDVAFERERDPSLPGLGMWLEVWVDAAGVHLTAQPEERDTVVPFAGALIDRGALAIAYRKLDLTKVPVDVIVRDDTTAQTLVEVLAALSALDLKAVALAAGPAAMSERKTQIRAAQNGALPGRPGVVAGQPNAQGDLDKPTIRFTVLNHMSEIRGCYERKLLAEPGLSGTVQTQFFIAPDGKVRSSSASGVHPDLASCVADVIRKIEFPKPDGGGGVQVNYPFTFRPAAP